ncbi:hypothetical protein FOL47_002566 [Perkinsus chesapeaki]|uniref:Uncharacterized protein n=1 Tax=Perkinsus chesapeaki TaxID=330153 RepID=A0A7J6MDE6_PERCH|nr:hypothetical protein FOL47_002566 [Perkinsus chesapeaki]
MSVSAAPSSSRGFRPPAGALNDPNRRSGPNGGNRAHNQPIAGVLTIPPRPLTKYLALVNRNELSDEPSGGWPWTVRLIGSCENALSDFDLAHPLETLHHVVENCTPTFDWSTVSLITNRGHLSDLLRFLSGNRSSRPFEFTIDSTGAGPAVIEGSWKFHGRQPTYGWSFEEAVTSPPGGSAGLLRHHAVSHLKLGEFNILVRAETDAQEADIDELNVSLSWEGWEPVCQHGKSKLWWQSSGNFRPGATLVEVKALSQPRRADVHTYFQLALGSCDRLVIGERQDEAIVNITEVTSEAFYERRCQPEVRHRLMARLGRSLDMILKAVEGRRAVVVWNGKSDRLIVREERAAN